MSADAVTTAASVCDICKRSTEASKADEITFQWHSRNNWKPTTYTLCHNCACIANNLIDEMKRTSSR